MAKVIEAKVSKPKPKPKPKKRMSKGARYPWQVWSICKANGIYELIEDFGSEKEAEEYALEDPDFVHPRIVHVNIPKMKY